MEKIKFIFLVLAIVLPLIFIILTIINFKNVKKSKKSKVRILVAIILLFSINFSIYKFIDLRKVNNTKMELNNTDGIDTVDVKPVNTEIVNNNQTVLNGETKTGVKIETKDGITKIGGVIIVNKEYSISEDYIPSKTFKELTKDTKSCATCIVEEVYNAFTTMQEDAQKAGIKLWIQSGYRSYSYQGLLYENYVKKDGEENANLYSAKPGHSEHQTGYAIDLNTINDSFANTKAGKWVSKNAYKYGFIIRYPLNKENETGYKYEPWHLRFVGIELSNNLYNNGDWITLESYFGIVKE